MRKFHTKNKNAGARVAVSRKVTIHQRIHSKGDWLAGGKESVTLLLPVGRQSRTNSGGSV